MRELKVKFYCVMDKCIYSEPVCILGFTKRQDNSDSFICLKLKFVVKESEKEKAAE